MLQSKKNNKLILIGGIILSLLLLFTATSTSYIFTNAKVYNETSFFLTRIEYWFCLLLIFIYAVKVEKRDFMYWTEKKYPFSFYLKSIATTILILILAMFVVSLLLKFSGGNPTSPKMEEVVKVLRNNKLLLIFTCVTAGITEELIFRGYILPRLEVLFKDSKLSIIISSLLFGLLHYTYGTFAQIIGPVFIGLIFAFHYQKYRNIKIIILCHFLWDLTVLLIKIRH